jgi:hypothetical protein
MSGWFTTSNGVTTHTITGARNMREHRERKRDQAELRNKDTLPERKRAARREAQK